MKKYLGIIIALLVGIGVFSIPSEVNAMTQKDLGGKVYLKQSNAPSQGVLVQIFLADLILVYWVPRNEGLRA